ncbi:hypothetical protein L7F22_060566 [Adiantum nelumboides]|nr:hypothetical protein [Adiantum nelumboides]
MEWITMVKSCVELHSIAVQLVLVLIALALLLWKPFYGYHGGRTSAWPPGPPAWPIVGHLHLLGQLPHQSLCKLSKTYGPLLGLRLGAVPTIVASSPQMAKEIMQTHDLVFANRPHSVAAVRNMYFGNMGFAPYGPLWKRMRLLCATELFNGKRLASMRHVREEEARGLARTVMATATAVPQQQVELRPGLFAAAMNIISRMAMGKKVGEVSGVSAECDLERLTEEMLFLLGVFYVGDFVPWLWWLDPHRYLKRMKAAGREAKALVQQAINQRRQQPSSTSPHDFLDVLLAAAADPNHDVPLTDNNISSLILDLFTGASDTSSSTVEWALADLINNPQAMHKLQEELDSIVGKDRLVTENDIENLPYLGLVLKESMRLHPVVPLLLPYESIKECSIGPYKIPAKTRAYVNTWAIGRDPLVWEMPLDFWPERFDCRNLGAQGQSFELLPFGAGRRRCPGSALAILNIHLLLATLVQGFSWSLASPSSPSFGSNAQFLDMSEKFGTTISMENCLCAFATPRLDLHIY